MGWGGSLINILLLYKIVQQNLQKNKLKFSIFSVFPEVADEPGPEKPAAEKQGSSNDRGNN